MLTNSNIHLFQYPKKQSIPNSFQYLLAHNISTIYEIGKMGIFLSTMFEPFVTRGEPHRLFFKLSLANPVSKVQSLLYVSNNSLTVNSFVLLQREIKYNQFQNQIWIVFYWTNEKKSIKFWKIQLEFGLCNEFRVNCIECTADSFIGELSHKNVRAVELFSSIPAVA